MKKHIGICILCLIAAAACRNEERQQVMDSFAQDAVTDTARYPKVIDGGKKIVYQFGHMTADKGLKLYFDTIPHPAGGVQLNDSVRMHILAK